jgi:hypothetical protein
MELPPAMPFTCHVTTVLAKFWTMASNLWRWLTARVAEVGKSKTGSWTLTSMVMAFDGSASGVAVMRIGFGDGTTVGAV